MSVKLESKHLKEYYIEHYPTKPLRNVIGDRGFGRREFAFLYEGGAIDRNFSFPSSKELVSYMVDKTPLKAYVSAIYEEPYDRNDRGQQLRLHNTGWVSRELVFDIDLDKYNVIRKQLCTCGEKITCEKCKDKRTQCNECKEKMKRICPKCFELAKEAVLFTIDTLDESFGIPKKTMTTIFSGRQGFHLWTRKTNFNPLGALRSRVSGSQMMNLEREARSAIINYLSFAKESKRGAFIKLYKNLSDDKFMRDRIIRLIFKNFFVNITSHTDAILKELGTPLVTKDGVKTKLFTEILDMFHENIDPVEIYESKFVKRFGEKELDRFNEVAIKYRYPRYDPTATKDISRVLKIPHSVDGSTGNIVSVVRDVEGFTLDDIDSIWNYVK